MKIKLKINCKPLTCDNSFLILKPETPPSMSPNIPLKKSVEQRYKIDAGSVTKRDARVTFVRHVTRCNWTSW
jgi:hypothetical protein